MEDKTNRSEHLALYLLIATSIFLWIAMLLAAFKIWSWSIWVMYAVSGGLFSSCIFEKRHVLKGVLFFCALQVLLLMLCVAIAGLF